MGSETQFNARGRKSLIPTISFSRPRCNTPTTSVPLQKAISSIPLPLTISLTPSTKSASVYNKNDEQQRTRREQLQQHSNAPHKKNVLQQSSTSSISVAELAYSFLEENVRNCIKPRIFPMESTSFPSERRVPTPFVFTSESRIHHHRRRVLGLNYMDEFLQRTAVFNKNRSEAAVSSYCSRLAMLSSSNTSNGQNSPAKKSQNNRADFASVLKKWSAPIPPTLSRKLGRISESPLGKVKVMLRVCDNAEEVSGSGILGVDQRRKQVTLIDPGGTGPNGIMPEERRVGVSAPKMFAFDGIFTEDDDQTEICAASAAELVASVVGGEDGCLVSLGYCSTGKRQTMFGKPVNQKMGAVPTSISWLFKSIQEQKQKTGSRFSVRVSAVEVAGSGHEVINDLLLPFVNDGDQPPGALLESNGSGGVSAKSVTAPVLNTVSEVRAPNPETAGFYLDSALDSINGKEEGGGHFVFTLHIYQYSIDKNGKGVVGGRSRLHCVLLGNGSPSISVLSGLLLAVLNGQRHLPSSNHSKLGAILRECLGSLTCRAVVMIHISNSHSRYAETLAALQLGSRVHRLRRSRRLKMGSVGSGTGSGGSSGGSGEEMRNGLGTNNQVCEVETGSSDIDPSSSEQSCDTVIYLGPSIDDATDGEHPPVYLPSLETTSTANGCETKIIPSKCPLVNGNGLPPKTKSPKPKSSNKLANLDGNFSSSSTPTVNGGKSEEKWIDGPKTSKYRQLQNQMNFGSTSPNSKKKGETWIDGPAAARVNHQASNFPSPKKSVNSNSHHQQKSTTRGVVGSGANGSVTATDPCCNSISSTKAEMIQKWISNQTLSPTFFDDISQLDDSFLGGANGCVISGGCNSSIQHLTTSGQNIMSSSNNIPYFLSSHLNNFSYNEPEYKSLTVFKEEEDEIEKSEQLPGNGYEVEFIEVVEPEIPVPTKDVCLQVTEEDIALSFLEEENPLPESDQNFVMASESYFDRARSASFSEGPYGFCGNSSLPSSEKGDDHPLRVLSQECLTVVSTFADSISNAGTDIERFWPQFTFNDITINDIHEMKMCHGLCKNLATLSQMSLDNVNDFPMSPIHNKELSPSFSSIPFELNCSKNKANNLETSLNHKPPTGKILPPPILSPDSIFKIPPTPKPRNSSLTNHSRRSGGNKDTSESEQDNISIPPMELLDMNQIKNNCNPIENQLQSVVVSSPKPQQKLNNHSSSQLHRGCDHNHHHNNSTTQNNINGTLNGCLSNGNSNGSGGSSQSIHSSPSTMTPPSSPSPIIPLLISEANNKSPSKSKSRKISKFFRTRSKSPKKAGATSSSESGKSSASSDAKHSSSSSSCSSGLSFPNSKPKSHSSPKHQSSPKKSSLKSHSCFSTSTTSSSDYNFSCDSGLPMFLPSPNTKVLTSIENGNSNLKVETSEKIKSK